MESVPWRPFGELSSVRREMDRLWNRFLGETPLARTLTEEWLPSMDISETEDKLLTKAELPGLEAKHASVSIVLRDTPGLSNVYSSYLQVFRLIKIEASFDKGVLKLTIPKPEEAKKKEFEIKV